MSGLDYPARGFDLTSIPTGPDGKPDPSRYIPLLQQLNAELTEALNQARRDKDVWRAEMRVRDARIEALQLTEYKVLKRWLRRAAIIEAKHDHTLRFVAILAGILAVGLPLGLAAMAAAWRFALWLGTEIPRGWSPSRE